MSTGKRKSKLSKIIIIPPNQKDMDDCVPRSLSIVMQADYMDVKKELKDIADDLDEEEYQAWTVAKIFIKQNKFVEFDLSTLSQPVKKVLDFAQLNLPGAFVISTPGHLTCVYNGWILDTWNTEPERIYKIWKFLG
jgi:hypothetical protein